MRIHCLIYLLMIGAPVWAQEERAIDNFAGVGVRAMGMGGAFVGVADDYTAAYWNPAGLAQIDRREVHVSLLRNSRQSTAIFNGTSAGSELSNTRFGSLGFVYPYPVYRGSLVFAVGFKRMKDFDWNLRQTGLDAVDSLYVDHRFQHEGELSLSSVAVAVDVSPSLSLGLALGVAGGGDEASNVFSWEDRNDLYLERRFLATDTFSDDYSSSWHATLGVMVRLPREQPRMRIGAAMSTSVGQQVRYIFRGSPDGYNRIDYDDGSTLNSASEEIRGRYQVALPLSFSLGGSYALLPGLLLAGGVHSAEWSQSEYEGETDQQLRADTVFELQYRDVVRYHFGVEWQVPSVALDLRAGFYTDPLPFVGPRDPDPFTADPPIRIIEDRRFFTLGAGLILDEVVQVNLAWARGKSTQIEENTSGLQSNVLREEYVLTRLFMGVAYHF